MSTGIKMIVGGIVLCGLITVVLAIQRSSRESGIVTEEALDHVHDGHGDHEEGHEERLVRLSEAEMEEFGVKTAEAGPGNLEIHVSLPGEVVFDPGRVAHIVPFVPGVVREVRKVLGDRVRGGEVMAVLESRELSGLKSEFLVAEERLSLAETTFRREEKLWKQNISSEREYLNAKKAYMEARIEKEAAEQKLHSIGFTEEYLRRLTFHPDEPLTRYEIVAPFDGIVIEKHIALGEMLENGVEAFTVANLDVVWVNLTVYQKVLPHVKVGQRVVISSGDEGPAVEGVISYISPILDGESRTAAARVVLENRGGKWRPGLFVRGRIAVDEIPVPVMIPRSSLQTVDGEMSVFVETDEGFVPQPVRLGRSDDTHVEIESGLRPGQRYVVRGTFTLKAQLTKSAFDTDHHH